MAETRKAIYKNIIGDTNDTINAIQRFIEKHSPQKNITVEEEFPADSINRVINSVLNKEVAYEIEKIIKKL